MNRTAGSFDQTVLGLFDTLQARTMLIFLISTIIFLPDMVALWRLLDYVLSDEPLDLLSTVFKGTVITCVFLFGVTIVAWASEGQPRLRYSLLLVGCILAGISALVMLRYSDRCISTLECNVEKFLPALVTMTLLAGAGFVLAREQRQSLTWLGFPFLLIACWQAFRFVFTMISHDTIMPNDNYLQAFGYFVFSIFWVIIYFAGSRSPSEDS